ncbi:high-affinity iron transporter [Gillisia sp. Hel1_33_143]|uniref:FTR1 family protein n=1 Tax=Gillisia sp. Hel1_33_143 TaxID=1336796 RepID=UPI00087B13CF|nr:FTR1 family protein [Gillisia sp. Hel1_33_143]SDR69300.1 high-affinity iron transporter [Gillisia sp. Hel1_33_143]
MISNHSIPSYFLYVFIFFSALQISAKDKDTSIQSVIHLLDYLSKDYPTAVRDGRVLDKAEYAEMQEFSAKIFNLAKAINLPSESGQSILSDLNDLKNLVQDKAPSKKVKDLAEKSKWAIIKVTGYEVAPQNWPGISNGQSLYLLNCVQCHGLKGAGNGSLAIGLKPAPANFLNDSLMSDLSPFEAYNTVKLGVEGTAMRAFTELSDKEAWDLAFYVKSLRFQKQKIDSVNLKKIFNQEYGNISLKEVATLSDNELSNKLGSDMQGQKKLKALRAFSPSEKLSQSSLSIARDYLYQALASYKNGNKDESRQKALAAYLEGIEPVEVRLKANDPEFTSQLEQKMMDVRQTIEQGENPKEVENKINSALSTIDSAQKMMDDEKINYWLSFFLSASIMLREGLEAFLIIALILALIRSTPGAKKALPYIHGGWIIAILMGVAGWFLSDWIIGISGQNREIMEGMISLIAVIVLAFVGFWLHNHSHSKKWKEFIEKKVVAQLKGEKMIGLAFFSFMVVFREAFESILFLQAIGLETQAGDQSSIGFGVLAAFALIGLIAFIFLKYSKKIPVRLLFRYSSWIITLLAVILIGKGVHAIQEAGWLSITGFPVTLKIDWLGIYPTLESLVSQLVLLGILMLLYYLSNYRNRVIKIK